MEVVTILAPGYTVGKRQVRGHVPILIFMLAGIEAYADSGLVLHGMQQLFTFGFTESMDDVTDECCREVHEYMENCQ